MDDSPRAFQLLRTAQDCIRKTANDRDLHRAYLLEMSILGPLANEGRDGNLERYRELLGIYRYTISSGTRTAALWSTSTCGHHRDSSRTDGSTW